MFSRRRAQNEKTIKANKAKAHNENHRRAKLADKEGVHPAVIQKREQDAKAGKKTPVAVDNGAVKPGAK